MSSRLAHAGFGVLSALVGVAAGHLVAGLLEPASSPVLVVGSTVIDLTRSTRYYDVRRWQELGVRYIKVRARSA